MMNARMAIRRLEMERVCNNRNLTCDDCLYEKDCAKEVSLGTTEETLEQALLLAISSLKRHNMW